MADALETARDAIRTRITEIKGELTQLEKALNALTAGSGARRRSGRPTSRRSATSGRRRAPRGRRKNELLASIRKHPNYRLSEHAKALGINGNHASAVVRELVKGGEVKKVDRGRYKAPAKS